MIAAGCPPSLQSAWAKLPSRGPRPSPSPTAPPTPRTISALVVADLTDIPIVPVMAPCEASELQVGRPVIEAGFGVTGAMDNASGRKKWIDGTLASAPLPPSCRPGRGLRHDRQPGRRVLWRLWWAALLPMPDGTWRLIGEDSGFTAIIGDSTDPRISTYTSVPTHVAWAEQMSGSTRHPATMPAAGIRPRPAQDSRPTREPAWAHGPSGARARPCSASRPVRGRLPMWTQAGQRDDGAADVSDGAGVGGASGSGETGSAAADSSASSDSGAAGSSGSESDGSAGAGGGTTGLSGTSGQDGGSAQNTNAVHGTGSDGAVGSSQLAAPRAVAVPAPAFRIRDAGSWPTCGLLVLVAARLARRRWRTREEASLFSPQRSQRSQSRGRERVRFCPGPNPFFPLMSVFSVPLWWKEASYSPNWIAGAVRGLIRPGSIHAFCLHRVLSCRRHRAGRLHVRWARRRRRRCPRG